MRLSCLACVVLVLALCGGPVWAQSNVHGISQAERTDLIYSPGTAKTYTLETYSRNGVRIQIFAIPTANCPSQNATFGVVCNDGTWEVAFANGLCQCSAPRTCCTGCGTCCGSDGKDCHSCCTSTTSCTDPSIPADPSHVGINIHPCPPPAYFPITVIDKSIERPANGARFCAGSLADPEGADTSGAPVPAEVLNRPPYPGSAVDDMVVLSPRGNAFIEVDVYYEESGAGPVRQPYWVERRDEGEDLERYLMIPTKSDDYNRFLGNSSAIHKERACHPVTVTVSCPTEACCTSVSC
jgi:hypothetical protein